jgi:hypothetical protein
MNSDWKDTAELIGITAIVASLIFVGLELRQSQRIAYAEMEGSQISDLVGMNEIVSAYSDLIVKLNSGEILTASERIKGEKLVMTMHQTMFFIRQRATHLDHVASKETSERQLAIWLHENPGVRELWSDVTARNNRSHEVLRRQNQNSSLLPDFRDVIEDHLSTLDRASNHDD